jgi:NAD(P)H-dependent FMN reductase
MTTILGLSGSLRRASLNSSLLRALAAAAPAGVTVQIATMEGIPVYDGDLEAAAFPEPVRVLKEAVIAADGLLLVSPEYNNGMPGALKNTIDWLSRPSSDTARVFGGKPVGLAGITPGRGATSLAQAAWLPVLRTLGTRPYFEGRLGLASGSKVFAEDGSVVDAEAQKMITAFIEGLARFVTRERSLAPSLGEFLFALNFYPDSGNRHCRCRNGERRR